MTPRSRFRRVLTAATLAFTITIATGLAAGDPAIAEGGAVAVVHIDGKGHGHGVGMSQWGAHTMASQGASSAQILAAFYPGTELAHRAGNVVVVIDRRDHARIRFPGGGEIRSPRDGAQHDGFPVRVDPGGVVDVVRVPEGYRVAVAGVHGLDSGDATPFRSAQEGCVVLCDPEPEPRPCTVCGPGSTTTTTAAPRQPPATTPTTQPTRPTTTTTAPPAGQPAGHPTSPVPVWAVPANGLVTSVDRGRTYRGVFELTGPVGAMRVRNHLDIEEYLKGMAEVPSTWPQAAVEAQAVAARTYAMRAMAAGGELCDSESCQVYVGIAHEKPGQTRAVDATRGVVVTYRGALAATFYSASGGGFAANVQEGFGADYDVPYLPSHPYPTANPKPWALDIALTDVAARLDYPGTITEVRVDRVGPSGRALAMTLVGDAGDASVDPQDFRRRLGLRSTLFTVSTATTTDAPPPPPPPDDPGVVGAGDDVTADADQFAAVLGTEDIDALYEALAADHRPAEEVAAVGLAPDDPRDLAVVASIAALLIAAVAGSGTLASYRRSSEELEAAGLTPGPFAAPAMVPAGLVAATLARWTTRSR